MQTFLSTNLALYWLKQLAAGLYLSVKEWSCHCSKHFITSVTEFKVLNLSIFPINFLFLPLFLPPCAAWSKTQDWTQACAKNKALQAARLWRTLPPFLSGQIERGWWGAFYGKCQGVDWLMYFNMCAACLLAMLTTNV